MRAAACRTSSSKLQKGEPAHRKMGVRRRLDIFLSSRSGIAPGVALFVPSQPGIAAVVEGCSENPS